MAEISYKWRVCGIQEAPNLEGMQNVVTQVSFEYVGTEPNGVDSTGKEVFWIATWQSTKNVGIPDPNNFIPLSDLTEAEVLEWCTPGIDTEPLKEYIIKNIEYQKNPMYLPVTMPWDNKID